MTEYTDRQRTQIALTGYKPYRTGDQVHLDDGTVIGYVSQVVDAPDGTQAYVVTDEKPGTPAARVSHVTVLYQGSHDTKDWLQADIPAGFGIITGAHSGVPSQFHTASSALKTAMARYPHAKFDVYGHSLGSMDGQYALADLDGNQAERVSGAYLYEGPNVYGLLDGKQRRRADSLAKGGRVRCYIDSKDIVGFGYGAHAPGIVGRMRSVDSDGGHNIVRQHMLDGYRFDKGKLKGKLILVGVDAVWDQVDASLEALGTEERALQMMHGGGLTGSEEIWLDEEHAGAIAGRTGSTRPRDIYRTWNDLLTKNTTTIDTECSTSVRWNRN